MPHPHPPPAGAPSDGALQRFPCPKCGSEMRYAPDRRRLLCAHCGHSAAVIPAPTGPWADSAAAVVELDYQAAIAAHSADPDMEETRVLPCGSCGAEITFEPDIHAKQCPYCASPIVTGTGLHRHIKPKGLIPFRLTEAQAHDAMRHWMGRLWFAPSGLKTHAGRARRMDGIYVPFWTYDADTAAQYHGQRGDIHFVTRHGRGGKPRLEQRVRWRRATGRVSRAFDDILVLASRALPKGLTDGLGPWDLTKIAPYQAAFLSGFRAEGYQLGLEDGFEVAKAIIFTQIQDDIRRDIGGDLQRIDKITLRIDDVRFKHILLPIWVAAYRYRGQAYRFVVNGQTGRVQGERPWSWIKLGLAVVFGALVLGAALYAFSVFEAKGQP